MWQELGRMDGDRFSKEIMKYNSEYRRDPGRLRKQWRDFWGSEQAEMPNP